MAQLRLGDLDIHYSVEGEGPWVTLAHPLAGDLSLWAPQMPVLTSRFKVLRYDIRGHGGTTSTRAPYTLERLAADGAGLLDRLGITRTHWVGLSMGGMIAQQLALDRPGLLDRVVLADSTARRPADAAAVWQSRIDLARNRGMTAIAESTLTRWFTDPWRARQAVAVSWVRDMIARTSLEGYCGCCAAIAQIDLLDRLVEIECEALIMAGEHDHSTPPSMSRQMSERWRGSVYCTIPQAAHIGNLEQVDFFNDRVMRFLTGGASALA